MKTRRERYVSITWLDGTNTNRNGFVWNMKGTREERPSSGGRERSNDPVPDSIERAIEIIESGGLARTVCITVAL